MSDTTKNLLVLLAVLCFGILGWYMYIQNRSLDIRITGGDASVDIQFEIQEFITQQRQLQQVSMHSFLYDDPVFSNLNNIHSPVPSLDFGRDNPFLE